MGGDIYGVAMKDEFSIKERELKWIGIDLDKTLTHTKYPEFKLTKPIKGAKEALKKLNKDGWKITISTSRAWADYENIERWLLKWDIPFRRIVCGKLLCKFFIDDRNIEFNGDWKETIEKLRRKI